MEEQRDILLRIRVDESEAKNRLAEIELQLVELGKQQSAANKALKAGTGNTQELAAESVRLKEQMKALRAEARDLTRTQELQNKATTSQIGSNEQLKAQLALLTKQYNALSAEERENTEAGQALRAETDKIAKSLKANESAISNFTRNVGNYQSAFDGIKKSGLGFLDTLTGGGVGLLAAGGIVGGILALGGAAVEGAIELSRLTDEINAQSLAVANLTGETGAALDEGTARVRAIADTFGKDFNEVLAAANAQSQAFGVSFSDSLDLVQQSFIAGSDAQGEYLDQLREYPALAKEAGLNAEEFNFIINKATTSGIYSDKGIDTIKEANLRLRELPTATRDALDAIGISSDAVAESLRNGSETTFSIIQKVGKRLGELPPQAAEVGTAIADIFGGPGEDAGLKYIVSLSEVSGGLDEIIEKSGALAARQLELLNSQVELEQANVSVARAFGSFGISVDSIGDRLKAFGLNIVAGVLFAIQDLRAKGIASFEGLGAGITTFIRNANTAIQTGVNIFNGFGDAIQKALKGDFEGARAAAFQPLTDAFNTQFESIGQSAGSAFTQAYTREIAQAQTRGQALATKIPTKPKAPTGPGASSDPLAGITNPEISPIALQKQTELTTVEGLNNSLEDENARHIAAVLAQSNEFFQQEQTATEAHFTALQKLRLLDRENVEATLGATSQLLGSLTAFFAENTIAAKVAGIAQATINTYLGATQAISDPKLVAAFPANLIAGGAIIASGIASVAKIAGVNFQFAEGGYTGDGGKYEPRGIVHGGEYVFSKKATQRLGLPFLESLHSTAKGYANGGEVGGRIAAQQASTGALSAEIAAALRNMPAPVVSVKEILTVSNRIKVKEGR